MDHSPTPSEIARLQAEINATPWSHEFEFPHGLKALPSDEWAEFRAAWAFIRSELEQIDFRDKSVLDLGCGDGYWSFFAERSGARSVLASDDPSQNSSASKSLLLAKRLLQSKVEVELGYSIYDAGSLRRRFDVVLCLGLYDHLFDPFLAFAQIRHCCHEESVVVVEGSAIRSGIVAHGQIFDPMHGKRSSKFNPDLDSLQDMLRSAYLRPVRHVWMSDSDSVPLAAPRENLDWQRRMKMMRELLGGSQDEVMNLVRSVLTERESRAKVPEIGRILIVCKPITGENDLHFYKPPFLLHHYDPRFSESKVRLAS